MVAALYVDARGPYPAMAGVDAWDEGRDATGYAGPYPVVAHPPCGPHSRIRHLSNETTHDLAVQAVATVRRWGGVLEQPAASRLWELCSMPRIWSPGDVISTDRDAFGGFTVRCEQVSWGHVARKKTWLYCVGVDPVVVLRTFRTGGTPTHWCSGGRKAKRGPIPPGIKACSAEQRRRTPLAFAEWLVMLAQTSRRE